MLQPAAPALPWLFDPFLSSLLLFSQPHPPTPEQTFLPGHQHPSWGQDALLRVVSITFSVRRGKCSITCQTARRWCRAAEPVSRKDGLLRSAAASTALQMGSAGRASNILTHRSSFGQRGISASHGLEDVCPINTCKAPQYYANSVPVVN